MYYGWTNKPALSYLILHIWKEYKLSCASRERFVMKLSDVSCLCVKNSWACVLMPPRPPRACVYRSCGRRQEHPDGTRTVPARLCQQAHHAQIWTGLQEAGQGLVCVRLGAGWDRRGKVGVLYTYELLCWADCKVRCFHRMYYSLTDIILSPKRCW